MFNNIYFPPKIVQFMR